MTRAYPLMNAIGSQVIPYSGATGGYHFLCVAFDQQPDSASVSIDVRIVGSSTWLPVRKAQEIGVPAYARADGPVSAVRVTISDLTGGVGPTLFITTSEMPRDSFSGNAAITSQSYTEANSKNGVQYEFSSYTAALASGATQNLLFLTGDLPVIIKGRVIEFDGVNLVARVYKNTVYTGGSAATYYNLSDVSPVSGGVTVLTGATVSNLGAEFGAPSYIIGSEGVGNTRVATFATAGSERILAPNTVYTLSLTNTNGAPCAVSTYLTWYEGETDLPLYL